MRKVCDPFSIDVHLTRRVERNVVLAANVSANVGDVNATLSLANIALARSIALRGTRPAYVHAINTLYQHTLSTHHINTPYHNTSSYTPLSPPLTSLFTLIHLLRHVDWLTSSKS